MFSHLDDAIWCVAMAWTNVAGLSHSLTRISIFAGVGQNSLEQIQQRCAWREYQPGTTIVDYLDATDDVYFICAGEAKVTIYSSAGKVVSLSDIGPGEVFGEYPAFDRGPRSANVEAKTNCLVASMPAAAFRELLHAEPQIADALFTRLVTKIRTLTHRVYEFSTLAVSNRIQAELLRLASLHMSDSNVALIDPAPTHSEIASRVSTHREAVTRELNRLARIGVAERRHNSVIVKDVARLKTMVHEATGE